MDAKSVDSGSGLDDAIEDLYQAARRYREYIKRNHPDRLAGVMWVRRGNELIVYSENGRYTQQVCDLTFDAASNSFSLFEAGEGGDEPE